MRVQMGVAVVALAFASTGCAAVFKGSKQTVEFKSIPGESDVRVDNRYVGATPVAGELDRTLSNNVVVSKEGFKDERVRVQRKPDTPWWIWDIATCAIPILLCIPLGVDAISGAWFSLDDSVMVKLDPVPVPIKTYTPESLVDPPKPAAPTPVPTTDAPSQTLGF